MLGLRPPGLEFRILCLEDSVISFISPSSGGSPGPVYPICAQRWPKARFILFLSPVPPDKMSGRLGESAERPNCVTGLGRSMGDVLQPLEMLGPEGVQAEIKKT